MFLHSYPKNCSSSIILVVTFAWKQTDVRVQPDFKRADVILCDVIFAGNSNSIKFSLSPQRLVGGKGGGGMGMLYTVGKLLRQTE